jgi:hypothetical protein
MNTVALITLDQVKAALAAATAAQDAVRAAWWGVGVAAVGAVVNACVVGSAFEIQRRQAKHDRALADTAEAKDLLGATVAIKETYTTLVAATRETGCAANVQGLEAIRQKLTWAERIVAHYLSRNLSDYILVQDLLRVQSTIIGSVDLVGAAISNVAPNYPIELARGPLPNALNANAAALIEIYNRATVRQPVLREMAEVPPVLVGTEAASPN